MIKIVEIEKDIKNETVRLINKKIKELEVMHRRFEKNIDDIVEKANRELINLKTIYANKIKKEARRCIKKEFIKNQEMIETTDIFVLRKKE